MKKKMKVHADTFIMCIASICYWGFFFISMLLAIVFSNSNLFDFLWAALIYLSPVAVYALPVGIIISLVVHTLLEKNKKVHLNPFPIVVLAGNICLSIVQFIIFENAF